MEGGLEVGSAGMWLLVVVLVVSIIMVAFFSSSEASLISVKHSPEGNQPDV